MLVLVWHVRSAQAVLCMCMRRNSVVLHKLWQALLVATSTLEIKQVQCAMLMIKGRLQDVC